MYEMIFFTSITFITWKDCANYILTQTMADHTQRVMVLNESLDHSLVQILDETTVAKYITAPFGQ